MIQYMNLPNMNTQDVRLGWTPCLTHPCLCKLPNEVIIIEIRYDKTLSLARSTSALLLQPGLDVLHNHDDIMISNSYLLISLSMTS